MVWAARAVLAVVSGASSALAQSYAPDELARRAIHRRAIEAVILGHAGGQRGADVSGDEAREC